MRESLILEYGSSLMEDEVLWPIGAKYLHESHDFGRYVLLLPQSTLSVFLTNNNYKFMIRKDRRWQKDQL